MNAIDNTIQLLEHAIAQHQPRSAWLHARLGSPGHAVSRPDKSVIHQYFTIELPPASALALVRRFRYGAAISTSGDRCPVIEEQDQRYWMPTRLWYAGDIPDWAVERIVLAKVLNIQDITIHSNQPLPTRATGAFTDPVVLGWTENPRLIRCYGRNAWDHNGFKPSATAYVIAIWDEEGEPSNDPLPLE